MGTRFGRAESEDSRSIGAATAARLPLPGAARTFVGAGIAGGIVLLTDYFAFEVPHLGVSTTISAVGFALTSVAVGLALAIYRKQDKDSRDQSELVNAQLVSLADVTGRLEHMAADTRADVLKIGTTLDSLAHANSRDDIEADLTVVQRFAEDTTGASASEVDSDASGGSDHQANSTAEIDLPVRTIPREDFALLGLEEEKYAGITAIAGQDIPLRPLSMLLNGLTSDETRAQGIDGQPNNLKPSDLGAYRTTSKGPKFWFIVVPTAPGRGRGADQRRGRSIWRVSVLSGAVERLDDPA